MSAAVDNVYGLPASALTRKAFLHAQIGIGQPGRDRTEVVWRQHARNHVTMTSMRLLRGLPVFLALLMLGVVAEPLLAQPPQPAARDVDLALSKVSPSLVRIHVV